MIYLHSLKNQVLSGGSRMVGHAAIVVKSVARTAYEVGCKAIQKTGEMIATGLDVGRKVAMAVKIYRDPNEASNELVRESVKDLSLKKILTTPFTPEAKEMAKKVFTKIEDKQNSWVLKGAVRKAGTLFVEKVYSDKEVNGIASRLMKIVSEENGKQVLGSVLCQATEMANSPTTQVQDFNEKSLKAVREKVHQNVSALLKLQKEKMPFFTLEYFSALIAYIAVKWFGMELDILQSLSEVGMEEWKISPELGEFFFLKFLEKITSDLLDKKEELSYMEVDQKWDEFVQSSRPLVTQFVSSKVDQSHFLVRGAAGIFKWFGDVSDPLSRLQPSKILPGIVQGLREASAR